MKGAFGILGLLVVAAAVGLIAKSQLAPRAAPAVEGGALAKIRPGATAPQEGQRVQQQVKESVEAALQQPRPVDAEK